ncbi:hypothetical protein HDU85_004958 [Gaertneriomyces sp. JEL0708]|nr:hypothetical protein HDU85_004958 [Gaertneriomyces sp. JEL0708]
MMGVRSHDPPPVELIPSLDSVTLCELNETIENITSNADPALGRFSRAEGVLFPNIMLPYILPVAETTAPPPRRLFVKPPVQQQVENRMEDLPRLLTTWYNDPSTSPIGPYYTAFKRYSDEILKRVPIHKLGPPLMKLLRMPVANRSVGDSQEAAIKAIAWQQQRSVIAMVHRQDTIHLYDIASEKWFPDPPSGLQFEFQKNVSCIEWNPVISTQFAVGSKYGVCLWRLAFDEDSRATGDRGARPAFLEEGKTCQGWVTLLKFPGFENVSSISWSPDGQYLAAVSGSSGILLVWDVATEVATPVYSAPYDSTSGVWWSPNGEYVIQACMESLRVYETRTWQVEVLRTTQRPHSVCWFHDSKIFMFAMEGDDEVHIWQINNQPPGLGCKKIDRFSLRARTVRTRTGNEMIIGGAIKSMKMDRTGSRLAVNFQGDHLGAELIALLKVGAAPFPKLAHLGFLRGPQWQQRTEFNQPPRWPYHPRKRQESGTNQSSNGEKAPPLPITMAFLPEYSSGGLLTVAWENGKIAFIPLYFRK